MNVVWQVITVFCLIGISGTILYMCYQYDRWTKV